MPMEEKQENEPVFLTARSSGYETDNIRSSYLFQQQAIRGVTTEQFNPI